ncbi:MAG: ABC transporter substrate-binding protein [Desulfobacteraceae bacterium]
MSFQAAAKPVKRAILFQRLPVLIAALCICQFFFLSCRHEQNTDTLRVGIAEEPRTLNIWLASDANSRKVLSLIYQHLYIRDPETLELTPWLAKEKPVYDPDTLSYTVTLRDARWSDGSPLTADDVVFTVDLIKRFKIPMYISKWRFVKKTVAVDDKTVRFFLDKPRAIFLTRSMVIPIVSRKEWADRADRAEQKEKPLMALMNQKIDKPLGCGPFVLKKRREGAFLYLEKNPHFFASGSTINGYGIGPHVDSIIFKIFRSADVAILALRKNSIDYYWSAVQPGHIDALEKDENTRVFISKKSAFYFMGFNARKAPFSGRGLRRAAAYLIDREFIISRILQGYADRMLSVVPEGNVSWYNPDLPSYGEGDSREERIRRAWKLLKSEGYTWNTPPVDKEGNVVKPSTIITPDGEPMEPVTILTPPADYDPHRAACGTIIQEWLKDAGIPASSRPMSFGALLDKVKAEHDFDSFILGYGSLSLDPDYLRSFFHSKNAKERGWNMSGYSNPEYDRIAESSARCMDKEERRELVFRLQDIVLNDVPYIPLYNPHMIEAVNVNRFSGWVEMVGGIGNLWSMVTLELNTERADAH